MKIVTRSPEETLEAGRALAQTLTGGEVLLLEGDLGAGQKFLHDHLGAALAEDFVGHHLAEGFFGVLPRLGDDDAFAQGETVGLYNCGNRRSIEILKSLFHIGKSLICRCGNTVFFHEVF